MWYNFGVMEISEIIQACHSFLNEHGNEFKLRPLFDELYAGSNDEVDIANFIGSLHDSLKRTVDGKLEDLLMDSHSQTFTPEERLLVGIRAESAIGALPTLCGAICNRAAPVLDLQASSADEAAFWAMTSFWSLVYSPSIMRAGRMLSLGGDTLLANCPM